MSSSSSSSSDCQACRGAHRAHTCGKWPGDASSSSSSSSSSSAAAAAAAAGPAPTPRHWTAEEHGRFLAARHAHGDDWDAVARAVGTRTAKQAKSHAWRCSATTSSSRSLSGTTNLRHVVLTRPDGAAGMALGLTVVQMPLQPSPASIADPAARPAGEPPAKKQKKKKTMPDAAEPAAAATLVVSGVAAGSLAAAADLRVGDRVFAINGEQVSSLHQFADLCGGNAAVAVTYQRALPTGTALVNKLIELTDADATATIALGIVHAFSPGTGKHQVRFFVPPTRNPAWLRLEKDSANPATRPAPWRLCGGAHTAVRLTLVGGSGGVFQSTSLGCATIEDGQGTKKRGRRLVVRLPRTGSMAPLRLVRSGVGSGGSAGPLFQCRDLLALTTDAGRRAVLVFPGGRHSAEQFCSELRSAGDFVVRRVAPRDKYYALADCSLAGTGASSTTPQAPPPPPSNLVADLVADILTDQAAMQDAVALGKQALARCSSAAVQQIREQIQATFRY